VILGKEVRLRRLFNRESDRILVIALDHAIGWGVIPGIDSIGELMKVIVEARPDAITVTKGIADKVFRDYAGEIPFIMKCTSFAPYHPSYDVQVGYVEEALRLGADAISVGCTVCGKNQAELLSQMGRVTREADRMGLPTVTHCYPKGELISKADWYKEEYVKYAARTAAELNVDIVKTFYTGDPDSFTRVINATPSAVVVSGGPKLPSLRDVMKMTHDAMTAGARGVTYGRNVWQTENPANVIKALAHIIHRRGTVDEAMEIAGKSQKANG
jgi:DhnA family fructose-bisphosphate aldolase class Ia